MQRLGRVARQHRHALLREHRPGVDALVDEMHRGPGLGRAGGERVLDGVRPGEGGQQRRVDVDDPAREALEEARPQQVHVAGADDELDAVRRRASRPSRRRARRGRGSRRARRRRSAMPAALRRGRARATPGAFEATATIGRPASISACRFVPAPQTSTPITRRPTRPRRLTIRPITRSLVRRRRPGRPRSSRCRG